MGRLCGKFSCEKIVVADGRVLVRRGWKRRRGEIRGGEVSGENSGENKVVVDGRVLMRGKV